MPKKSTASSEKWWRKQMPLPSLKMMIEQKAISLNQAYPTGRNGRRYLDDKARAYKESVSWQGLASIKESGWPRGDGKHRYFVNADFYFRDMRVRDIDDYFKLLLDSFNGIIWKDDSQIESLAGRKWQGTEDKIMVEVVRL